MPELNGDRIEAVARRLETAGAGLPAEDGVGAFNLMYLLTTREVGRAMSSGSFADQPFLTRLDEVFAGLYLDALERSAATGGGAPEHWAVLFAARRRPLHPLQFAVAGMNAHINADLAQALVLVAQESGRDLHTDEQLRRDFLAVNQVLGATQPIVKRTVLDATAQSIDGLLGDVDDRVGLWGIEQAREFAWTTAQALWAVRGSFLFGPMVDANSRMVGLTSKLLLGSA